MGKFINEISIVIPCYNEENRILSTIMLTEAYLINNAKKFEIIIVDDGSSDETVKVVEEYFSPNVRIIMLEKNKGKGYAVKTGVQTAKYNWTLFMDADNSTRINMLERMWGYKDGYEIIIGSRNIPGSNRVIKQPFFRSLGGKIFSRLVDAFINLGIYDTQCGFKLMETNTANEIFKLQTINRFAFDVELLKNYRKQGLRIKEVPIIWYNNGESKVTLIKDTFNMFKVVWSLRENE